MVAGQQFANRGVTSLAASVAAAGLAVLLAAPIAQAQNAQHFKGFYGAVSLGEAWGQGSVDFAGNDDSYSQAFPSILYQATDSVSGHGLAAGATVGTSFTTNGSFYLGGEVELQSLSVDLSSSPLLGNDPGSLDPRTQHTHANWLFSPMLRLGLATTPDMMLFARAGWAFAGVSADNASGEFGETGESYVSGTEHGVLNGPRLGLGGEWILAHGKTGNGALFLRFDASHAWLHGSVNAATTASNDSSMDTFLSTSSNVSGLTDIHVSIGLRQ